MPRVFFFLLKVSLALTLSLGLLYFTFRHVPISDFWNAFSKIKLGYFTTGFILVGLIPYFLALQWDLFFPSDSKKPFAPTFHIVSVWLMVVNCIPFWVGHAVAVYLLVKKQALRKTVALSVMVLDQLADGFARITLFSVVAWMVPLPDWMKRPMQAVFILVSITYCVMFALAWRYRRLKESEHVLKTWIERLRHSFYHWAHAMAPLRSFKQTVWAIILAILVKATEAFAFYLVQQSFGLNLPWWSSPFLLVAVNLATMVPVTPGQIGLFEAAVSEIYRRFFDLPAPEAAALAIAHHVVHVGAFFVLGFLGSVKLGLKSKDLWGRN